MSDFLAEARVVVRPDTTAFRTDLVAQLKAATRGVAVTIPVAAAPTTSGVAAAAQQAQVEATKQLAVTQKVQTQTTLDQARADQILGAGKERLLAVSQGEAAANRLITKSAAQLAEAETLASLKTTELAAARARLAASDRAVATGERAVISALASGNAELVVSAKNTLGLAQARELEFRTAVKSAIATNELAAAQAKSAATSAGVAKGVGATGLAIAGARGATLAASNAFLVGAAAAVFFAKSIEQAIDAEETFRRSTLLLGTTLTEQLADQAQSIGEAFALDDDDVLKFETQIGKILVSVGFASERTAELSENVVRLAADMSTFNRVPIADTLNAIQRGLTGNTRGLKQLGVLLSVTEVNQLAMAQSGKENAASLSEQEKVLARLTLIQQKAAFQQGAFAAQAGSLSGQAQELGVNFENLQETIGERLIPPLGETVRLANNLFEAFGKLRAPSEEAATGLSKTGKAAEESLGFMDRLRNNFADFITPGKQLAITLKAVNDGLEAIGVSAKTASGEFTILDGIAGKIAGTLGGLSSNLEEASAKLAKPLDTTNLQIAAAQATGNQGAELAGLRDKEARQAADFARKAARAQETGLKKAVDAATESANRLAQTRAQIKAIVDQQAAETKAAAVEVQASRNKADQALLAMLGGQQDAARNLILRAQGTAGLGDDLKFNKQFLALIQDQIDRVQQTVRDAQTKAAQLSALKTLMIQVTNQIKKITRDIRQAQRDAQEQRLDRLQTSTQLDIELADINENTKRSINLRLRLIAQLKKEAKVLDLQGNALKENRNARARLRKEIEDLRKQEQAAGGENGRKQAAEFFFEQLQAQQGFAANLLGNLITGPTEGLVGVPAPPTQAIRTEAAAAEGRAAGPTAGQSNTEIDVLRRILNELRRLNGSYDSPEAITQKKSSQAIMDGIGGV